MVEENRFTIIEPATQALFVSAVLEASIALTKCTLKNFFIFCQELMHFLYLSRINDYFFILSSLLVIFGLHFCITYENLFTYSIKILWKLLALIKVF